MTTVATKSFPISQQHCAGVAEKSFVALQRMAADIQETAAWLRAERIRLGWSAADMADRARAFAVADGDPIKLTQQSISKLERGDVKRVPSWLRYVKRAVSPDQHVPALAPSPSAALAETLDDMDLVKINEVDLAYSMGGGSVIEDNPRTKPIYFPRHWLRLFTSAPADAVFFARGRGDSMQPTLLDGDIVLIDRSQSRIFDQDLIWAVGYNEAGAIKRVRRVAEGNFKIISDNPNVSEELVTGDELYVVGRVIWIGRRM